MTEAVIIGVGLHPFGRFPESPHWTWARTRCGWHWPTRA